ncbi:MAG: hypothetical protein AAGK28_05975 [Pseudomonadota bacterium]
MLGKPGPISETGLAPFGKRDTDALDLKWLHEDDRRAQLEIHLPGHTP